MRGQSFRPTRVQLALVMGLIIVLAGVMAIGAHMAQADPQPAYISYSSTGAQGSTGSVGQARGIPAIHPRAELVGKPGAHFVEADVRQYFATTPPPFVVQGTAAPTLASVGFLPTATANAQLHTSINAGDTGLVCVVRFSGTFLSTYGPLPPKPGMYVHQEVLIFDAQTGNLLTVSIG